MTTRKLTSDETLQVITSAKWYGRFKAKVFDFKQDTSLRYTSNGLEYWAVVTESTLHSIEVPSDSHICNVIGNFNYTKAYKQNELLTKNK